MQVTSVLAPIKKFYTTESPREVSSYSIKVEGNVTNKETYSLVNTMSNTYSPPKYRMTDFNIKSKDLLKIKKASKIYWDIVFTKGEAKFYLTMDDGDEDAIISKARTTWSKCKLSKLEITNHDLKILDMKTIPEKCASCNLVLKTYNYKSLNTDASNQYPLTNMMGLTKSLNSGEFVRVNIAIEPMSRLNWISLAKDERKNFDNGIVINNEIGIKEQMIKLGMNTFESAVNMYIEYKLLLLECIFGIFFSDGLSISDGVSKKSNDKTRSPRGGTKSRKFDIVDDDDDLISSIHTRSSSNYKSTAPTFKTKITVISQSDNIEKSRINMLSIVSAYKDLTNDNELVMRTHDKKETEYCISEINNNEVSIDKKCILSDREICKLIQLPQRGLQEEYRMDVIETREVDVPKELQNGTVRIGEVDEPSKNVKIVATFPNNTNLMARKTVIVGGENSGKTTQATRFAKEYYKSGISNFVIDHQENGKLTVNISKSMPKDSYIVYDVYENMPPLAFVEISKRITEDMDGMLRLDYANMISKQVELFVNSITDENTGQFTGRMKRFLHSACMIVFIKPKTTINDVFLVLKNWKIRNEYLRYARYSNLFDENDDVFIDMEELHKRKSEKDATIIGTRDDLIVGITNRIATIKQNPRIKSMLSKPYDESDDFDKYIQSGKSIFIKIPQNRFPDDDTRDMLAVFYFSRLWLTVQTRDENKDSKLCNVILDEIKALPTLAMFMDKHITEFRRHRLALLITAHGLAQFGKLLTQLLDSGANFIILPPCEKKNLEALKEEMKPFTIEECMNLKPHHGLCIINYGNRYAKFVARMYRD